MQQVWHAQLPLGDDPAAGEHRRLRAQVHELAHLAEPNHTPEFWLKMERVMSDYERRKRWLAEHGASYLGL